MSKFHGGPGHPKSRDKGFNGMPEYYDAYSTMVSGKYKPVKRKVFNKFNDTVNRIIREMMIDEGFEWNLPYNLGTMAVYKYKRKIERSEDGTFNLPINQRKTAARRRENPDAPPVYFTNPHTGGWRCRITWIKNKKSIHGISEYAFATCKPFRYSLYKALTDPDRRVIDNYFIFESVHNTGDIN